ncbi:MAG: WbqC family protein [Prevotella sp.]|nr:WbqC family protein [Prevotella sp.]
MTKALLATTYFGPVQWYQKLNRHEECVIDVHESFLKQTYRNRCIIATANGPLALTVPVERGSEGEDGIRRIRISEHGNWRHQHWNALCSAYGESPFFDYYVDDLRPMFEPRWEYLIDMNMAITELLCSLLDIHPLLQKTDRYLPRESFNSEQEAMIDYRDLIRPKHAPVDVDFQPKPYWQVFSQTTGFQPNLSVLDLLFCQGNEAVLYL